MSTDFADKICNDINDCNISYGVIHVIFGISIKLSEWIFSKWLIHGVTQSCMGQRAPES